jgi:hypothetical protein
MKTTTTVKAGNLATAPAVKLDTHHMTSTRINPSVGHGVIVGR